MSFNEFSLQDLIHQQITLSHPKLFNDPFEYDEDDAWKDASTCLRMASFSCDDKKADVKDSSIPKTLKCGPIIPINTKVFVCNLNAWP